MKSDRPDIRLTQVAAAATVIGAVDGNEDVAAALDLIVSRLRDVTGSDGVAVELEREGALTCCYASGPARRRLGRSAPLEGSLAGACLQRDEPLVSGDVGRDRRFQSTTHIDSGVRSMISVPLHVRDAPVGVLRLTSGKAAFFRGHDLVVARVVASSIGRVLVHEIRDRTEWGPLESTRVIEALWTLRDRRRSQRTLVGAAGYQVALLICRIDGYLTSEILGHVRSLVRDTDQCAQQDAGTYAIVMPGTSVSEAEAVGGRLRKELLEFAAATGDHIQVSCEVRRLTGSDALTA